MPALLHWLSANWPTIASFLGVWSLLATLVNRTMWPKPAAGSPQWRTVLHAVLIDGPSFLPSVNLKGLFGLPFNVPFMSLSAPAPDGGGK